MIFSVLRATSPWQRVVAVLFQAAVVAATMVGCSNAGPTAASGPSGDGGPPIGVNDAGQPDGAGQCASQTQDGGYETVLSGKTETSDQRQVSLTQTTSYDPPSGTMTTHLKVSLAGAMSLDVVSTKSPGGDGVVMQFGAGFEGAKGASFASADGKTMTGTIDGRQVTPFAVGAPVSTVGFADGQPAPALSLDPVVGAAMKVAFDSAQKSCGDTGLPTPMFFPTNNQACEGCLNSCIRTLAECSVVAAAATLGCLFPPACGAAIAAAAAIQVGCDANSAACVATCSATDCCPKLCGVINPFDPGSGCCDSDEHCASQSDPDSRHGCCPKDQNECGGDCCAKGDSCCGNGCCSAGSVCLQDVCCPAGTPHVCNGQCCAGECGPDGSCCTAPAHVCPGGNCCPPLNPCCNGVCCGAYETCHPTLNICCAHACGPVCCPTGQLCTDAQAGTCGAPPCSDGQLKCYGLYCCAAGEACCDGGCWPEPHCIH